MFVVASLIQLCRWGVFAPLSGIVRLLSALGHVKRVQAAIILIAKSQTHSLAALHAPTPQLVPRRA